MIKFENVTKAYPDGTVAVDGLNLEAPTGKLTILVGPSGCGKTTSLRMINRLIEPTSGTIYLDDQPTSGMDAALLRRRIGYVIQHAGLFPHRSIVDNVATMPVLLGESRQKARTKALELMERVGLPANFAKRYPWQLSGGQQQRVGVARALASDPAFMLMDEPFSAVDPVVRAQLQDEFLRLQREIGKTIIMVTHDIDEALKLGDQVAVMRVGGKLAQMATPSELLTSPADAFVADFVGTRPGLPFAGLHQRGRNGDGQRRSRGAPRGLRHGGPGKGVRRVGPCHRRRTEAAGVGAARANRQRTEGGTSEPQRHVRHVVRDHAPAA
jgi:osmoprotectant transport system ATP-binding protein